jgi:alkylhydroperoxidase family enzyme
VSEGLRATLGFLEKLTLTPDEVGPADAADVRAAGVSADALRDAIYVCALFNMITRMADALDFALLDERGYRAGARHLLARGYA